MKKILILIGVICLIIITLFIIYKKDDNFSNLEQYHSILFPKTLPCGTGFCNPMGTCPKTGEPCMTQMELNLMQKECPRGYGFKNSPNTYFDGNSVGSCMPKSDPFY